MAVTVYGASDDLIEIEGDIEEEFYPFTDAVGMDGDDGAILGFSNGTVLRIIYNKRGIWRITEVVRGAGGVTLTAASEDDEKNYSDRATIDAPITWVVKGNDYAVKR